MYLSQWKIVATLSFIILINAIYTLWDSLYDALPLSKDFNIGLLHGAIQMLPISVSIAYYQTNDIFIDISFAAIFIIFLYDLYTESNKMAEASNNNVKMLKIICLCIMLDYIQVIVLILSNLYWSNSFYFYKFIISGFPMILGVYCSWIYMDIRRLGFIKSIRSKTWDQICISFKLGIIIMIGGSILLECANAAWIIFLYNEFFEKFRNGTNFNEKLKDELVLWLQEDQYDLLIKLCCINHIKLLKTVSESQAIINQSSSSFLSYLQSNVECNRSYYKNVCHTQLLSFLFLFTVSLFIKVTWREFKKRSGKYEENKLGDKLWNDVKNYYEVDSWRNDFKSAWNAFRAAPTYDGFHQLLGAATFGGFLFFCSYYAMIKILSVFIIPFITVYLTYDEIGIHQIWFNITYFVLLIVICYRLWTLIRYEMIMWYVIPDLLGNLRLSREDIDSFHAYYKYINGDIELMKDAVSDYVGEDVANIVMLYTPDYITIHHDENV